MPFFDANGSVVPPPVVQNTIQQTSISQPVAPTEVQEKTTTVRVVRKLGGSLTPSIKDAMAGKALEKTIIDEIGKAEFSEYEDYNDPFTPEQLEKKWREFLRMISDRPNLIATLSVLPEISDGNKLLLKIGNSVQEEEVRLVKPELLAFLKRELRNSGIELNTVIEKIETERTHFNDSEKMQILMKKNPELYELKQKFNLDFNG